MRVALRPLAADDAELIVAWRSQPEVNNQLFSQPPTVESHRAWFGDYRNRTDREEFIVLLEGRAVGTVGLSHIDRENRRAEYRIIVFPDNAPALRLYDGVAMGLLSSDFPGPDHP